MQIKVPDTPMNFIDAVLVVAIESVLVCITVLVAKKMVSDIRRKSGRNARLLAAKHGEMISRWLWWSEFGRENPPRTSGTRCLIIL